MVILKTFSQAKSFYKRMSKKRNHSHTEGCGCCYEHHIVEIDATKKRIVLHHFYSAAGSHRSSCEILAIIK